MERTIKILGAGPSGLTASINLARAGYNVEVYEKNKTVGKRFSGCFQILENYTEKEELLDAFNRMNVKINFFCHPSKKIDFYDSKLNLCSLKSKKPYGYFIKRGNEKDTLDYGLAEQAEKSGVKIIYNENINTEKADIIAVGANSAAGIAKEIVFDTDSDDTFKVILDNNIAPKGFTYLFVINKKGTLGTAVLKKKSEINRLTAKSVGKFQKTGKFEMNNQKEVVSYVNFYLPKSAKLNNSLKIGEAAGFQDNLFGIGTRIAVTSGYLAAKSIIENIDYDELWKKHIAGKMKMSMVNRFFYELCGNTGYSLFNKTAKNKDIREFGYKLYKPDCFRNSIFPFIKIAQDIKKKLHKRN